MMKRFEEKIIELFDSDIQYLWIHYKNGDLWAFDEVCVGRRGVREAKEIHGGGMNT